MVTSTSGFAGHLGIRAHFDVDQVLLHVDEGGWAEQHTNLSEFIGWRIHQINGKTVRSFEDLKEIKGSF